MSFRDKTKVALRDLIESQSEQGVIDVIRETLESGKLKAEDYSIREIWDATEGDKAVQEAVSSDMFPKITGELINRKIIEAYNNVDTIGDKLVTTTKSNMEIETYAGFDEVEMPEKVLQGGAYNDSDMGEKYVTIPHAKYGRLLSVTEEMIYFDKTGQILMRANRIGMKAAQYKEQLIVEGVQDVNSNVFRPSGVAADMYRTADSGTLRTNSKASNPFGEAGLTEALKLVHNQKDENGNFILVNMNQIVGLLPYDLWTEALQMLKSTLVPEGNENAVNVFKNMFTPLTSPYITAQSASTWFLGDFKQDFVWSEVWPLQTFSAKAGHEQEFERDIKARFKVRFYGQVGAIDSKYSYKFSA